MTRTDTARLLLEALEPRVLFSALPAISLAATKNATELNGLTTGAGLFTFTRTGPKTSELMVAYTIDPTSTALNGTDYNTAAPLTGTVDFPIGSNKATLTIHPVDTGKADGPMTITLVLGTGNTPGIYVVGAKHQATIKITDDAPTVTVSVSKRSASEINGTTTGRGVFTFKRTGPTTLPLTIDFSVGGTAAEGADYIALASHSITIPAGSISATVTIIPIDDAIPQTHSSVALSIISDGSPASYHFKSTPATITIAEDTRPIRVGTPSPLPGATSDTPFDIPFATLVTATGVQVRSGHTPTFKITALTSGTLQKNGTAAPVGTLVSSADTLTWTSTAGVTGTVGAFGVMALDGKAHSATVQILIDVSAAAITGTPVVLNPVLPAALDQPQINVIAYAGNNTSPQYGTTTTLDPDTLDNVTVTTFNTTAYLDTGASSVLISNPTNTILNLPTLSDNGTPVIYSDVGVAGSDNFQVTDILRLATANSFPRTDLDQFSDAAQTIPITAPYTPIAAGPIHAEVGPFVPTVDNPVTDDFSSLFDDLSAVDVVGMPAMMGRVVVIDPTRVNNFGDALDALLNDPLNIDPNIFNEDFSVHSYIYAPGTPFHPNTTATDPGIPTTGLHVQLSYADFSRFTQVTPAGDPGPTIVHNPIIGEDPVSLMEGIQQPDVPGIKVARTIDNGSGGTQTLTSEGNWLLDTGAASTIISKAQAAKLDVTYQDGTFGTDNPVLVDQNGAPLPDQFLLQIGGIGGQETLAGFYLDSLLLRTTEGSATNDANPNNLVFSHEPVLVGDVTVKDPVTGDTLTLDGIFGMNNLVGSADFSLTPDGDLGSFDASPGNFNWITFDEPNGILGLNLDPSLTAATPSTAAGHGATASLQAASVITVTTQAVLGASAATPTLATPLVIAPQAASQSPLASPAHAITFTTIHTTVAQSSSRPATSLKFVQPAAAHYATQAPQTKADWILLTDLQSAL